MKFLAYRETIEKALVESGEKVRLATIDDADDVNRLMGEFAKYYWSDQPEDMDKNITSYLAGETGNTLVLLAESETCPVGIDILERELGIRANVTTNDVPVELTDYVAGQDGFTFSLDAPDNGYYLIPVARNAGTRVFVDGEASQSWAIDNLTMTKLTAGTHQIVITSEQTTIYPLGVAVTALGGLIIAGFMLTGLRLSSRVTSFTRGIRVPAPLVGVKR